jgi:hypothetical protein
VPETSSTASCDGRIIVVSGTSAIPLSGLCVLWALCGEKAFYGSGFTPVGEDCSITR